MIYGSYLVYEETITENLVLIRSEESGTLVFAGKDNRKGGVMAARSVRTPESDSSAGRTLGKKVEDPPRLYSWLSQSSFPIPVHLISIGL